MKRGGGPGRAEQRGGSLAEVPEHLLTVPLLLLLSGDFETQTLDLVVQALLCASDLQTFGTQFHGLGSGSLNRRQRKTAVLN